MSKSKDYLKEVDGGVEVTLVTPADIDGQKRQVIKLREPLVSDSETASKSSESPATAEINLIANLCEVSPADLRKLSLRNYKRLTEGLSLFTD